MVFVIRLPSPLTEGDDKVDIVRLACGGFHESIWELVEVDLVTCPYIELEHNSPLAYGTPSSS